MGTCESKPTKDEKEKYSSAIKAEKITKNLDGNIDNFQNKVKKLEVKIEDMKQTAKQKLAEGKEKEAKKIIKEVARLKKQLQAIETRKKVIQQKKIHVEMQQMNKETIDALGEANQFTKEDYTEKMEQHIIDAREQKMNSNEVDNKMKDLVEDDQDQGEDDLMEELKAEVSKQKKKNISQKNVGVALNTNMQTQKHKAKQSNDIDKLLNEL